MVILPFIYLQITERIEFHKVNETHNSVYTITTQRNSNNEIYKALWNGPAF